MMLWCVSFVVGLMLESNRSCGELIELVLRIILWCVCNCMILLVWLIFMLVVWVFFSSMCRVSVELSMVRLGCVRVGCRKVCVVL